MSQLDVSSESETRTYDARIPNRRMLFSLLRQEIQSDTLTLPLAEAPEPGARVKLRIAFGDSDRNFYLSATVAAHHRAAGELSGISVRFLTLDERRNLGRVVAFCSGRKEASRRFAAFFPCQLRVGDTLLTGRMRDISVTGAFIAARSAANLREGTAVDVVLRSGLFGLKTRQLRGQVAWLGEKDGTSGLGVSFNGDTGSALEVMKSLGVLP